MSWLGKIPGVGGMVDGLVTGKGLDRTHNEFRPVDPHGYLGEAAGRADDMARMGEQNYQRYGNELDDLNAHLRGQTLGVGLVSTEALRQGLQRNIAGQRSMAAGASPANQAMAARTAMMQAGRLGAGFSGQQAIAAMQERNLAQQQLGQNQLAQQQAGLQFGLQNRNMSNNVLQGIEDARTKRFGAIAGTPTATESQIGAATGLASAIAGMGSGGGAAGAGGYGVNSVGRPNQAPSSYSSWERF